MELDSEALKHRIVANAFPQFSTLSEALGGLGFVQADPIRSPARAQDLILRQRVRGYRAGDLEDNFPQLEAEEGFLFAYGFMRRSLWESSRWRSGKRKRLVKLERQVIETVRQLGEVHPRDLDEQFGRVSVVNDWGGKSLQSKRILEDLHHRGYLRVARRVNGVRVYQYIPESKGDSITLPRERFGDLVLQAAKIFGPVTRRFLLSEMRYHFHLAVSRRDRLAVLQQLLDDGVLSVVVVEGREHLWIPQDWPDVEFEPKLRILSPFDPLVRDRDRFEQLWGWTYRFEAYVPAAKRVRGYYAMPVLWGADVIGWVNARVEEGRLRAKIGYAREKPKRSGYEEALEAELGAMSCFLGLEPGGFVLESQ